MEVSANSQHVLSRGSLTLPRYWLVSMHVTAALVQAAGVAKYTIPVSDMSCRTTARAMVVLVLLFDVRQPCMHVQTDVRVDVETSHGPFKVVQALVLLFDVRILSMQKTMLCGN